MNPGELNLMPGMTTKETVAELQRATEAVRASRPPGNQTLGCGCSIPNGQGYCYRHDYTLVCWVEGCDLPFPHLPNGPEHVTSKTGCGCYYHNGGDFDICATHQEA